MRTILLYALLAGAACSIPLGYIATSIYRRHIAKYLRPANGTNPVHIGEARISSDLIPLLNELMANDASLATGNLCTLGNDGCYVIKDKKGEKWSEQLVNWCRDGLEITYILMDVNDRVSARFSELMTKSQGRLQVVTIDKASVDEDVLDYLEHAHPTLLSSDDGESNASWMEGFHASDSDKAYDVLYVSPEAMRRHPGEYRRFQSHRKMLDDVLGSCVPLAQQPT